MKKIILFIVFLLFITFASKAQAARLFSENQNGTTVIYLDTEGESINTISGSLRISKTLLPITEVNDGNSSINFWLEHPREENGSLSFAGITTGGIRSDRALLFSVAFKAEGVSGTLTPFDMNAYASDGAGTPVRVSQTPIELTVGESGGIAKTDKVKPERFIPFIAEDSSVFDGKYFLAFATGDKDSGIDHYEVKEGFLGSFKKAESPYLLRDQKLRSRIAVKAIDKEGNEQVVVLYGPNALSYYVKLLISGIIILIVLYILRKKWHRFVR